MMAYSTIFGIILLSSGGIAFALGLYTTNGNVKTIINKLLIIICFGLLIWTLGLAIVVAAANVDISLIGHLVAPIGWGPMSGLLLHYTLVLTKNDRLLKKWWIYPMLYLPGIITIYAFILLPIIGQNVDSFTNTTYGWVPVANVDGWDYFFYVYYISFTIVNILLLIITNIKSQDKYLKNTTKLLVICYIASYTLGTISDIILHQHNILMPRVSPIFSLIPVGALAYSLNRYVTLSSKIVKESEISITDDVHTNLYRVLGFGFIIASIINIISQNIIYIEKGIPNINRFTIFLLVVAVMTLFVSKIKVNDKIKEMIIAITFSFLIPYATLRYVKYGSITVWAFIFLLVIICVLYDRKILLITIIMASIRTQFLVWAISPAVIVEVNASDYVVRFSFIIISAILSLYVNNIYLKKLKENTSHVEMQNVLSHIVRDFIAAEEWNMDEIIYNALEKCGKFIKSERAYIVLFEKGYKKIHYSSEWLAEGIQSHLKVLENLDSNILHKMLEQFETDRIVKIPDYKFLPPMAGNLKSMLMEQNICAMVNLPIKKKDKIIGFMGFNSSRALREWNLNSTEFIEIVSNIVSDILIKIENEKKIKFLAYHDQLTQLPNRSLFKELLEQAIKQGDRLQNKIGVVFIDIDSFKTVNDTMGHDFGDKLLFEVSQMLSSNVRNYDIVSRFGGDEFVILLNHLSDIEDAVKIMDELMRAIRNPINLYGQELFVTISAGVALYPLDGDDPDTLIKNADAAMYQAKGLGKNQYLICSQDMKNEVLEKMFFTNSLHRALEKEQLVVYYQPQVNIENNSIVGLEALLRWFIPEKGMISPATFIPLAEQSGLINPIGEWVLETACRQNKQWQDMGFPAMRMAVNISVYQLNNPNFVQQVEDILRRTGLSPENLELEVTESAVSTNVDNIIDVLTNLKRVGVIISIDDFGTEYSSLSRLKLLPIDRIKMDMQFVRGLEENEKDQAITKVIINLAKSMNLKVIAEGVETKGQLDFLSQRLCDEVQGYYFYKPMPAEEIEKVLIANLHNYN
jgi:diguanylate cyclase (GGDEF)-like protein